MRPNAFLAIFCNCLETPTVKKIVFMVEKLFANSSGVFSRHHLKDVANFDEFNSTIEHVLIVKENVLQVTILMWRENVFKH